MPSIGPKCDYRARRFGRDHGQGLRRSAPDLAEKRSTQCRAAPFLTVDGMTDRMTTGPAVIFTEIGQIPLRDRAAHRANLIPRCPAADLFGIKGRAWLSVQDLPRVSAAAAALLRQLDFHTDRLRLINRGLGQVALGRPDVRRLMTIPGVDATVALSIVAAVGEFSRFRIRRSWSPTSASTRGCPSPVGSRPATAGSPSRSRACPGDAGRGGKHDAWLRCEALPHLTGRATRPTFNADYETIQAAVKARRDRLGQRGRHDGQGSTASRRNRPVAQLVRSSLCNGSRGLRITRPAAGRARAETSPVRRRTGAGIVRRKY
jgi:hypothetical protein